MLPRPILRLPASVLRPHGPRPSHALQALRRGSVIAAPEETAVEETKVIDSGAVEYLCSFGLSEEESKAILDQTPASLNASQIETLFHVLTTDIKLPITQVVTVISAAPELLSLDGGAIASNYETIAQAWPNEKQLRRAALSYPAMLNPSFPSELRRCMTTLQTLGFSNAQTAAAVTACPRLTGLRRYEITSALAKCGIGSRIEDPEMLNLLAKNPNLLTPEGSTDLQEILKAVRKATGVTPQQAQHIVARGFSGLLDNSEPQAIRKIADLLRNYGLTPGEVSQAALAWPLLLSRKVETVEGTLQLLSSYGIKPSQIANYPSVFGHRQLTVLGPRLAYLSAYNPSDLSLYLGTLFKCSDTQFSWKRVPKDDENVQSYGEFRVAWLVEQKLSEKLAAKGKLPREEIQNSPPQQQQQEEQRPPPEVKKQEVLQRQQQQIKKVSGPAGQNTGRKPQRLRYFNGSKQQLTRLTPEQLARNAKQGKATSEKTSAPSSTK